MKKAFSIVAVVLGCASVLGIIVLVLASSEVQSILDSTGEEDGYLA